MLVAWEKAGRIGKCSLNYIAFYGIQIAITANIISFEKLRYLMIPSTF